MICHWLLTFHMKKIIFSGNFWCTTEKAAILLASWSTLYVSFSKQKMSWILLVDFHLKLVAQIPSIKLISVLKLWVLRENGINIFLFVDHPICSIFNAQSVLILDWWFYFVTSYPNSTCKKILFSKFRCSAKEATILTGHPENGLNFVSSFWFVTVYKDSLRKTY